MAHITDAARIARIAEIKARLKVSKKLIRSETPEGDRALQEMAETQELTEWLAANEERRRLAWEAGRPEREAEAARERAARRQAEAVADAAYWQEQMRLAGEHAAEREQRERW